jgi:hypothetical protein
MRRFRTLPSAEMLLVCPTDSDFPVEGPRHAFAPLSWHAAPALTIVASVPLKGHRCCSRLLHDTAPSGAAALGQHYKRTAPHCGSAHGPAGSEDAAPGQASCLRLSESCRIAWRRVEALPRRSIQLVNAAPNGVRLALDLGHRTRLALRHRPSRRRKLGARPCRRCAAAPSVGNRCPSCRTPHVTSTVT